MQQLLENTLTGGMLILATALLRHFLKGRLHPDTWLLLWGLCLARLLSPISWNSSFSLYSLTGLLPQFLHASSEAAGSGAGLLPALPQAQAQALDQAQTQAQTGAALLPVPVSALLTVLYCAAAVILAGWFIRGWLVTRREVNCTIPLKKRDPRRKLMPSLPRRLTLREGPMQGAPLTFGAFFPTVVLSPGLQGRDLQCVLTHEGVHARRMDNLWHYAAAVALVFHWFNPAVWLLTVLLRRDIELSCDRAALNILGAERRAEYANALLTLSTQAGSPAFCHCFGPKRVEERILAIMKYKKTTAIGVALALALVLCLSMAFASTPAEDTAPAEDTPVTYEVVTNEDDLGTVSTVITGGDAIEVGTYTITEDGDGFVCNIDGVEHRFTLVDPGDVKIRTEDPDAALDAGEGTFVTYSVDGDVQVNTAPVEIYDYTGDASISGDVYTYDIEQGTGTVTVNGQPIQIHVVGGED